MQRNRTVALCLSAAFVVGATASAFAATGSITIHNKLPIEMQVHIEPMAAGKRLPSRTVRVGRDGTTEVRLENDYTKVLILADSDRELVYCSTAIAAKPVKLLIEARRGPKCLKGERCPCVINER